MEIDRPNVTPDANVQGVLERTNPTYTYISAHGQAVSVSPYTIAEMQTLNQTRLASLQKYTDLEVAAAKVSAFKPISPAEMTLWLQRIGEVLAAFDQKAVAYKALDTWPPGHSIQQARAKLESILLPTLSEGLLVGMGKDIQVANETELMNVFTRVISEMGVSPGIADVVVKGLNDQMRSNPAFYAYLLKRSNDLMRSVVSNVANTQQHEVLVKAYQGIKEVFDFDRDVLFNRFKTRRNDLYAAKKKIDRQSVQGRADLVLGEDAANHKRLFGLDLTKKLHSIYVKVAKAGAVEYKLSETVKDRAITFYMTIGATGNIVSHGNTYNIAAKDYVLYRHLKFDEAKGVNFKFRAYPYILKKVGSLLFAPTFIQVSDQAGIVTTKASDKIDWTQPLSEETLKGLDISFGVKFEGYAPGTTFNCTFRTLPSVKQIAPQLTYPESTNELQNWLYLLSKVNVANYQMDQVKVKLAKNRKYRLLKGDEKLMKGVMQYWGFKEDARQTRAVTRGT